MNADLATGRGCKKIIISIGSIVGLIIISSVLVTLTLQNYKQYYIYRNPVNLDASSDEIVSLPELNHNLNFKQYSGYLKADNKNDSFFHYWFVESQSNPSKDPLILWLNGGPGCSSLTGLLTELGPFLMSKDGKLIENQYSWNKNANVLFLESPAGVGFSYSLDANHTSDDDSTAMSNFVALEQFYIKFPQFKNGSLYLTGESYAGVYLPMLAVLVDRYSDMNLKGIAIGNGYLDEYKLQDNLGIFLHKRGFINQTTWDYLDESCCKGREQRNATSCILSNECQTFMSQLIVEIYPNIYNFNPYNVAKSCLESTSSYQSANITTVQENKAPFAIHERLPKDEVEKSDMKIKKNNVFCQDDSKLIAYLNREDVKDALHIPRKLTKTFELCAGDIHYQQQYAGTELGLSEFLKQLMGSKRAIKILIFNGDLDMVCNFVGIQQFVDDLNATVIADTKPWFVNNTIAGNIKIYQGITLMTVKDSGHFVPTDKPAEALYMLHKYLLGYNET